LALGVQVARHCGCELSGGEMKPGLAGRQADDTYEEVFEDYTTTGW
jgi:hypothetical protein